MSTLRVNGIQNTSGVEMYMVRAIVTFKGTDTLSIFEAKNVSSVVDNGSGDYTVNFTNAMPSIHYATAITPGLNSGGKTNYTGYLAADSTSTSMTTKTTSACRITTYWDYGYITFMAA